MEKSEWGASVKNCKSANNPISDAYTALHFMCVS